MNDVEQSRELRAKLNIVWREERIYRLPKYKYPKPVAICNMAKLAFRSYQAVARDCVYTVRSPTDGKGFSLYL